MSTEIKVPTLPESVADATVVAWHKSPGDTVERDEVLVDIETDKVVLEVYCPEDGVLGEILQNADATVTAGQVLAVLLPVGDAPAGAVNVQSHAAGGAAQASTESNGAEPAGSAAIRTNRIVPVGKPAVGATPGAAATGPAVRNLLRKHQIDASEVPGSGRNGRITSEDVHAYVKQRERASTGEAKVAPTAVTRVEPSVSTAAAAPVAATTAKLPSPQRDSAAPSVAPTAVAGDPGVQAASGALALDEGDRPQRRVPMTRLRARIAERLLQACTQTAMLTTFNEVNMQPLMDLRARYKDRFAAQHEVKLGFMSLFVKAAAEALKRFPDVNASIDGRDIIYHGFCDIGIAVSSDRGLVVPVLRNVEYLSLAQIETGIANYADQARAGKLALEALQGGTFTITNGGVFGSMLSTPILNPPQSAILGMHATQERPVAEKGQVVIRPMMYLALSYDHRIIDGKSAVSFLKTIKELVEEPTRILLDI